MPRRLLAALLYVLVALTASAAAPASVPDKVVVLTFDDASASHHAVARPLLKRLGFGATFFITEGFTFRTNKRDYLTWEQIAELHREGFEIGNHTRDHLGITEKNVPRLAEQLEATPQRYELVVAADVFVPSDVTLRLSIVPAAAALNTPHSCHAQFASLVPNVARQVTIT